MNTSMLSTFSNNMQMFLAFLPLLLIKIATIFHIYLKSVLNFMSYSVIANGMKY